MGSRVSLRSRPGSRGHHEYRVASATGGGAFGGVGLNESPNIEMPDLTEMARYYEKAIAYLNKDNTQVPLSG